LKRLLILLLLTSFGLLSVTIAGADFWPNGLPSLVKSDNTSSAAPKVKNFNASLAKTSLPETKSDPWPATPPKIGRLVLKQEYWNYMKEAAQKYQISPYLIEAVCAIESRFDPQAHSGHGQCYGLMQLHRDTARKYGVDSHDPRQNIMGGAAVLSHLLTRFNGDLSQVLHVYNATCTPAYEREVKKAFRAAMQHGLALTQMASSRRY
jgi:soluble lytic murein transglycosylase-like protein